MFAKTEDNVVFIEYPELPEEDYLEIQLMLTNLQGDINYIKTIPACVTKLKLTTPP